MCECKSVFGKVWGLCLGPEMLRKVLGLELCIEGCLLELLGLRACACVQCTLGCFRDIKCGFWLSTRVTNICLCRHVGAVCGFGTAGCQEGVCLYVE